MFARNRLRPKLSLRWLMVIVAAVALGCSALTWRVRRQRESIQTLRGLGAQLDLPPITAKSWLGGLSVDAVLFLGPAVGDESVESISRAAKILDVRRVSLVETRFSPAGVQDLQRELPELQIRILTPVPSLPGPTIRNR